MGDEEVIQHEVEIKQYNDGFDVIVDGERFSIDQEETVEKLQEVFHILGIPATYEDVY